MDLRRGHRPTASSDLPTTVQDDDVDPKASSKSSKTGFIWCDLLDTPSKRRNAVYLLLFLALSLVYRHLTRPPLSFHSLGIVPTRDAKNWGEFVAYGRARAQMLERTDPGFPGLGERYLAGMRTRSRLAKRPTEDGGDGSNKMLETRKGAISGNADFERERHGIYGGAHWDWATGIVGVGSYLGPLDMRKRSSSAPSSGMRGVSDLDATQKAALQHYLSNAWEIKDKNEAKHRKKVLALSLAERLEKGLPMRDVAAGNKTAERDAAELWTRVYAAFHRQSSKSALQLAIEKMVRRVPVVVFVEGEGEELDRAKKLFKRSRLSPEPLVIDVQQRPDGKNVIAFLKYLTEQESLPNIVVGGRTIGGVDDLEALEAKGELVAMLQAAGTAVHGSAY